MIGQREGRVTCIRNGWRLQDPPAAPRWSFFKSSAVSGNLTCVQSFVCDDEGRGTRAQTMIARPVTAALGCCGCRNAILRAVLSKPAPASVGFLAQRGMQLRQHVPSPSSRAFSSGQTFRTGEGKDSNPDEHMETPDDELLDTPWFLEVDPPRHPPIQHAAPLPKVPDGAPPLLEPMMKYIYEDMGLDELSVLDLRDLDPPAALGPNLIMLFGTARSERHLHISAGRFVRWLKRNYQVAARADGLIGPGELRTKLRRLRKKAKLMGTNASVLPGGDNGISTGWVCVNFGINDSGVNESPSFDESGRFSGFGTPITGTTIVVQCMTESRRSELDLETLWLGVLKRSLQEGQKIRGKSALDGSELDALVSSKVQLPTGPSAVQWQALKQASEQQRQFSTLTRRLQQPLAQRSESTSTRSHDTPAVTEDQAGSGIHDLSTLRQQIHGLQASGASLSPATLQALISAVFLASPFTQDTATERLAIVDQLCLVAEERGMSVMSNDWLVTLIESIVASPAYGPELQRAQKNLKFLLEKQPALDHSQVLRLMAAYAHRLDWDRFWDVFRTPPRYQMPRSREHYELAYRVLAATGDRKLCTDALRWVYPEMLKEQPPIWPTGSLYTSLKGCILVADPAAEELLNNPPPTDALDLVGTRRLMHREFVRVLREVEDLRRHHVATRAREERAEALNRFSEQVASSAV